MIASSISPPRLLLASQGVGSAPATVHGNERKTARAPRLRRRMQPPRTRRADRPDVAWVGILLLAERAYGGGAANQCISGTVCPQRSGIRTRPERSEFPMLILKMKMM